MANITAQVILHPTVSHGLKFGGTTVGRDKTYRALQYFSRFLAWYFDKKSNNLEAARWAALKAHISLARKLIRLGKPMEHLQAAFRASLSNGPPLETLSAIARQLGYFGFLSYDAIVWAQAVRLINLSKETTSRIQRRSFQFWFAGIVFSLVHGGFKSARLAKESKALKDSQTWGDKDLAEEATRETKLSSNITARKSNQQQIVLDLLDIWIPATGAGLLNINEGILGIVGLISSLIGANAQWETANSRR